MKQILFFLMITLTSQCYAQKVSDIFEHGVIVKKKGAIFLRLNKDKIKYEIEESTGNFDDFKNGTFFLLKGEGANIYLSPPLNPLDHSSSIEITFEPDAINAAVGEALGAILARINTLGGDTPNSAPEGLNEIALCSSELLAVKKGFENLATLLKIDKKNELADIFSSLKSLSFEDRDFTKNGLEEARTKRRSIDEHFNKIKDSLADITRKIDVYNGCAPGPVENFIYVYVMNKMIEDANAIYKTNTARLANLDSAIHLVNKTYEKAEGTGKNWFVMLDRVSMQDEKIASSKVVINTDGYLLSDNKEIVKSNKSELVLVTLKFRKFQRFVPEVSAGIAHTQLKFPKFSTEIDASTGKLHIVEAGEEKFKQLNFTSMINFNYYYPNSPIHPFWQIGIGANADYPTLLTGIGFRMNVALRRLAFSIGYAGTWVRKLQTLNVNDEVESPAKLEEDLKHEFSFPLKPYIGIQINF